MKYLPTIFLAFLIGCSLTQGKREIFTWEFRDNVVAGNYVMNCLPEKVDWDTHWGGNLYLNCIHERLN